MLQNIRENRPVFITICASIIVFFILGGLLAWHYLGQPPTPPAATCGDIVYLQGGPPQPVTKNVAQIEQCFYHAYQQCAAMSITIGEHGTDTGASTVYWPVRQGDTCQVIAQSSTFSPVPSGNHMDTETCQGVIQKNGGLLFQQCGGSGDVFIAS